jgi:beta-phosphoglucomutase-like phosphatase (HAD superfamily)
MRIPCGPKTTTHEGKSFCTRDPVKGRAQPGALDSRKSQAMQELAPSVRVSCLTGSMAGSRNDSDRELKAFPTRHSVKESEAGTHRRAPSRFRARRHRKQQSKFVPEAIPAARPPVWTANGVRHTDQLPFQPGGFIFDVEGTLVDTALPTLQCWSETLAELGFSFGVADLHPFSGMDGKEMLHLLLKKRDPKLLDHIVKLQAARFKDLYLPHTRALRGVRRLFQSIKDGKGKISLATSCDRDELARYRALIGVDDLLDGVCCGDDVKREKPSPAIVRLAVEKLRLPPSQIVMVGDTPCDAEAARGAGVVSIGLQSGHFSRADLSDAGHSAVFFDLQALTQRLEARSQDGSAVELEAAAV